jgi:hypothetical protein
MYHKPKHFKGHFTNFAISMAGFAGAAMGLYSWGTFVMALMLLGVLGILKVKR